MQELFAGLVSIASGEVWTFDKDRNEFVEPG